MNNGAPKPFVEVIVLEDGNIQVRSNLEEVRLCVLLAKGIETVLTRPKDTPSRLLTPHG